MDSNEYGHWLMKTMREANLSQKNLSDKTGIPSHVIYNYMQGKAVPTSKDSDKIARALNVKTEDKSGQNEVKSIRRIKKGYCGSTRYHVSRQRVTELMNDMNIGSYSELAQKVGCSESTVNRWMNGKSALGPDAIKILAEELNTTVEDIVEKEETKKPAIKPSMDSEGGEEKTLSGKKKQSGETKRTMKEKLLNLCVENEFDNYLNLVDLLLENEGNEDDAIYVIKNKAYFCGACDVIKEICVREA